jgi:hypothetical protein
MCKSDVAFGSAAKKKEETSSEFTKVLCNKKNDELGSREEFHNKI